MPKAAPYTASNGFAVSINQHGLLSFSDMRRLVASVLAVAEREAGHEAAGSVTFCNILGVRKPRRAAARGGPRRDLGLGWPA